MKRIAATLLALCVLGAAAQTVTLQGMLGNKALLVVNGGPPKTVAPGDSWQGVKVLSTSGDQAVVEVDGDRRTLRVGEAPFSQAVATAATAAASGASSAAGTGGTGGTKIVITASSGGHFISQGSINGRAVQFLVDTGATGVGLSVADAERIGIDYKTGRTVRLNTANGTAVGWLIKLGSVRLGDVEVHDVEAAVSPGAMPYVLLGNSFLERFQMRRDNDQMVLERRY